MVIHGLGDERNAGHPAESRVEIVEEEALVDGVTTFDERPAIEGGQEFGTFGFGQAGHERISS
jgi:hypothetical protein